MKTKLKNIFYIIAILTLFTSSLIIDTHAQPKKDIVEEKKLTICHYPPGNNENVQEIEINENSLNIHLEHGDYIKKENEECKPKAIPTLPEPVNQPSQPVPEPINPEHTNSPTYEPTSYPSPQTLGVTTQATSKEEKQANYSSLKPVYRFLNIKGVVRHIYIIDYGEYLKTLKLTNEWKFEGIAFYAWMDSVNDKGEVTCNSDKAPVYRFFSIIKENHVFTIDEGERITLVNDPAYEYEGIKFCVYRNQIGGTNPVYRFWHFVNDKHFYTISEVEKNELISKYNRGESQWRFEGIKFFAVKPTDYYKNKLENSNYSDKKFYKLSEGVEWCESYKYSVYDIDKNFLGDAIFNPLKDKTYLIPYEFDFRTAYYNKSGDTCENLGLPVSEARQAAKSKYKTEGGYQLFEKGGIYYSEEYGTHSVYGIIYNKYENMEKPGGTNGKYGFPKGEVFKWEEQNMNCQWFEGGKLCEYEIAVCGNKVVESRTNEQCDDGNTTSGDGCSNMCKNELACLSSPYKLPWKGGMSYYVTQDELNEGGSHCPNCYSTKHAIDFGLGFGDEVVAVQNGEIVYIEQRFRDNVDVGGSEYSSKANYILIEHANETQSIYVHIMKDSVSQQLYSNVSKGEIIAKTGFNGWNDGVHLHYSLRHSNEESIETLFSDKSTCNVKYKGIPQWNYPEDDNIYPETNRRRDSFISDNY
jgi:cysteine-rich repeat protein